MSAPILTLVLDGKEVDTTWEEVAGWVHQSSPLTSSFSTAWLVVRAIQVTRWSPVTGMSRLLSKLLIGDLKYNGWLKVWSRRTFCVHNFCVHNFINLLENYTICLQIFLVQIGMLLLEIGSISPKNTKAMIIKNIGNSSISAICFYLLGYWLFRVLNISTIYPLRFSFSWIFPAKQPT